MLVIRLCVCVCVCARAHAPDAPPGSRPALQVHHPRVTGPHQGGVSVSSGTVPQVDNTNTQFTFSSIVICPPNTKLHPNHSHPHNHNEQNLNPGFRLTHKPGLGSRTHTKVHTYASRHQC